MVLTLDCRLLVLVVAAVEEVTVSTKESLELLAMVVLALCFNKK